MQGKKDYQEKLFTDRKLIVHCSMHPAATATAVTSCYFSFFLPNEIL